MNTKKTKKEPRRLVTVMSETNGGCAGWHASFKAPEGGTALGMLFRELASDIVEAEVKAAACAIAFVDLHNALIDKPLVLLQMRNLEAIGVLLASDSRYSYSPGPYSKDAGVGRATHVPASCVAAVATIRRKIEETGASLCLRLVASKAAA